MAVIGLGFVLGGAILFKDVRELRKDVRSELDAANVKMEAAKADVTKAKLALVEEKEKLRPCQGAYNIRIGAALRILEEEILPLALRIKRMGERYLAPIYYNAACYACLLDAENKEKVLDYLEKAIDLNEIYRGVAPNDADLAGVHRQNRFERMCAARG